MEDETGFVNVVLWGSVYEKHALTVKTTAAGDRRKVEPTKGFRT